jgi:hypothetical protein
LDDPRQIEAWNTANVARVYLVRAPELPMVDVRVAFDMAAHVTGAMGPA